VTCSKHGAKQHKLIRHSDKPPDICPPNEMSQKKKLVRGSKGAENSGEVVETLTWVQIIWWHVWANGQIVRRWSQCGPFCSSAYIVAWVSDSGTADEKLVVAFLVSVTVQTATYCTTWQRSRHSDVMGWTVRDSNPSMHKDIFSCQKPPTQPPNNW